MDRNHYHQPASPPRRPTLDEALQRTPLVSIAPFMHDTLSLPQAGPTTLVSSSLSTSERSTAHQALSHYEKLHRTSTQLQHKLDHLRTLLAQPSAQPYQFPPRAPPPPQQQQASPNGHTPSAPQPPRLSNFATALLISANVPWSASADATRDVFAAGAATPSSPRQIKRQLATPSPAPPAPPRTSQPSPLDKKQPQLQPRPPPSHALTPAASQATPPAAPLQTPSGSQSSQPMVVMTQSPHRSLHHYQAFPELDAQMMHLEQEREAQKRRQMALNTEAALGQSRPDIQERATGAVRALEDMLSGIFAAEDQLAPDTSGATPVQDQDVFTRASHGDEPFLLSSVTLVKLDSSISKVTNSKRLDAIHVEYLLRAQRLCHKVVLQCADADLAVPEDASEDAVLGWLPNVEMMDSAMLAARVIIKIMTGRREKRELCSDEILTDVLNVFRPVVESTIIPIVEMKATAEPGHTLKTTSEASAMLSSLVQRAGRVLRFLGDLLRHVELSETAFTQVEDLCMKLIFVTNSSTEKESVLGIQKLETFRRLSMDVLATVFFRRPDQRKSIMSDMLSSLEKLPVARQSARQFKIEGRKSIQLVSALVMQLVQTTASLSQAKRRKPPQVNGHAQVEEEESDADAEGEPDSDDSDVPHSSPTKMQGKTPVEQLATIGRELLQSVNLNARYICNYLVTRALSSSKTSDEPYRNLLDIFTEDFINVLGASEWPAAELLLQQLLREMLNIMNKKEFGAPAKNMALDIMGVMGSGIADLRHFLEKSTQHVDDGDDIEMSQELQVLSQAYFQGDDISQDLISLKGPYRAVIEILDQRAEDDLQLQQARSYLLLQWAQLCWTKNARQSVESNDASSPADNVASWLRASIETARHISETSDDIGKVSTSCSRIASALVTVNMTFCRANQKIFQVLVQCMDSTHATVRSRALKSVYQFMEKDPSVLAGASATLRHIFNLAQDSSPLVRDSALTLIGKVIVLRPELESRCLPHVVTWTSDSSFGIRKRAVKLVKDVYEQTKEEETRLSAAAALLQRLSDDDMSVKDLARQSLSDLWMQPYFKAVKSAAASVEEKLELQRHASRLIAIADQSEEALNAFEPLFSGFLSEKSANAAENRQVCKAVVTSLFETFIENEQQTGAKSRQSILAFFAICAQAGSNIFTYDQLALLQHYTHNHKTTQDLRLFQKVAKIYNATFPFLSSARHGFIEGIQYKISASVTKIPPEGFGDLMDEATKCLWTISQILRNDQRVFSMWHQTVAALEQMKNVNDPKLRPFIFMAGYFGKNWNMEPRKADISKRFPKRQFATVSNLLVQVMCPIVNPARPLEIQRDALNSVCLTCLTNPSNFLDKHVVKLFNAVLQSGNEDLQRILLIGFRDFFVSEEAKGRTSAEGEDLSGIENSAERLGKSMKSSEGDDALNQLGQMYSADVFRLARSPKAAISLAGVEIIASVNRQGLVVPRENIAVLICLETSPVQRIAKIAFDEHRRLNTKHESIVEKVYVLAFGEAFKYQRDVVGDGRGFIETAPKLKLFFTVLKESSIAARKTFLKNICKQLKPASKDKTISELLQQYQFVKFVCENLGLAEFARVDEVMIVIDALEATFGTLGSPLSQEIEALNASIATGQLQPNHEEQLRRLALQATTLSLLWHTRTCLRDSTTNLPLAPKKPTAASASAPTGAGRPAKNTARDPTKPPNPSTNRLPIIKTFLAKSNPDEDPLATEAAQHATLRAFMDLHSIDHDAKPGASDDDLDADALAEPDATTPSLDGSPGETGSGFGGGGAKRKRSVSGSAASTPTKGRKRGRPGLGRRKSSFGGEGDGDADFMV